MTNRTPKDPIQLEKEREKRREWERRYREEHREEYRERKRKWRDDNREKVREYVRNQRKNASDETKARLKEYWRAYGARYYQEHKKQIEEQKREYRARNPEKVAEWDRRRTARRKLLKELKGGDQPLATSASEARTRLLLQDNAFAAAYQYVPRNLPRDMRDDIISDIVVACLECRVAVEDVKGKVQQFIAAHNRAAGYNVSLDAELSDGLRLIDRITEDDLPW